MAPPIVWVIDDSETVRIIVQTALLTANFQVQPFVDGIEALRWAMSNPIVPDVILVDIVMPRLSGYGVIHHLREHFQSQGSVPPPFVVLSRRDGVVERLKARLAGASGYVFKPFTPAQIVAVCNRHIRSK